MRLNHPTYDPANSGLKINDPVKTFYLKTDKELISGSNDYVSLYINHQLISFTNQFKRVIIDELELYEIMFFENEITLMMNLLDQERATISIIGWQKPNMETGDIFLEKIYMFKDIYYEKGEPYDPINSVVEQIIVYKDSPLTRKVRLHYGENYPCKRFYGQNTDNVIRYGSGLCGLAYAIPYSSSLIVD
jgi:hypothetical protein